jgi:catechol 2,3-dioxygenase-like lactoylglutathione lyase family enzyme
MGIVGLAHTAVCVPDVEAAVRWYRDVLGLTVLSPPYLMAGPDIERDMGEMIPGVELKAAILGFDRSDHVLEVIEYPRHPGRQLTRELTDPGLSHVGLVCDDLAATRVSLEAAGARFVTTVSARVAGLRTAWFVDPHRVVFILIEKGDPGRPYWRQSGQSRNR